jgi:hypothetical protein
VVDVSDPAAPRIESHYADSIHQSWGITLKDTLAFIADDYLGMKILDISDPHDIIFLGAFSDDIYYVDNIAVSERHAYLANWAGVIAVDITDPRNPIEVGRYDEYETRKMAVEYYDGVIYYNDYHEGTFYIRDVAKPDSSFLYYSGSIVSDYVEDYYINFPVLFVPGYFLKVVHVGDPVNPFIVEGFESSHYSTSVTGVDSILFSAGSSFLIASFDMSGLGISREPDGSPSGAVPRAAFLHQNYPNPFNPNTTITMDVPAGEASVQKVKLAIYDIRGRFVKSLVDSGLAPGRHRVVWDGRNSRGERVSSGMYIYTMHAGNEICSRKMLILQ